MGRIPFHNREAFLNEFAFEALRCAINGAGGWESAKKIITENAEFLGVDVTKAQENESQVYLGMINASFRSLSQIKEEFERLCEENAADDPGGSGSSGGGGGSGGTVERCVIVRLVWKRCFHRLGKKLCPLGTGTAGCDT